MLATAAEPLSLSSILPDAVYGLRDFCRVFPARNGGRLSVDVARRWAAAGKFGFYDLNPGGKRKHWAIRGSSILGAIAAAERTAPATAIAERLPTPAERLKLARQEMQAFADRTGRAVNSRQFGETFEPRKAVSS